MHWLFLSLGEPSLLQSVNKRSSVGGGAAGKDVDAIWPLSVSFLLSTIGGMDHSSSSLMGVGLSVEASC